MDIHVSPRFAACILDLFASGRDDCFPVALDQRMGPDCNSSEYPAFVGCSVVIQLATLMSYWETSVLTWAWDTVIMGNGHNGSVTRGGVIRRNPDLNPNDVPLLELCANNSLSATNTMCKHKCTRTS